MQNVFYGIALCLLGIIAYGVLGVSGAARARDEATIDFLRWLCLVLAFGSLVVFFHAALPRGDSDTDLGTDPQSLDQGPSDVL